MKKKQSISKNLYYGLLLLILICNTIALLRNGKSYVDGDSASELMLSKLLNEEHRIMFSPNWIYSTELRALNTQFFYRIGMALSSNNWLIARLIAHVLMWVFLIVCFKYFMKQSKIIPPLCISLIAIIAPFSEQYIRYVLYCGYYIPHITLLLLMLALYYKYSEKPSTLTLLISLLLAFGAGLGGVRQLLIGYFPLFITVLLIFLNRKRGAASTSEFTNDVWYPRFKYSFYTFLACGIGWAVNLKVLSRFFTYINTYTAMTLERMEVMEIVNFMLNSVFEILGYEGANEAISLDGIAGLTAMVYAVVILLAIFICVREYKHLSENQQFMVVFFSVCAITYAAFCVLSDFHSVRYMIPSLFCMFVLLDIAIERFFADNSILKKPVITIGILAICLQAFCNSYIKDFRRIDQNKDLEEIAGWLIANHYLEGYSSTSNALTELTDGTISVWNIPSDENWWTLEHQDWLETKEHAARRPSGKVFLVEHTELVEQIDSASPMLTKAIDSYHTDDYQCYVYDDVDTLKNLSKQTIVLEK